MNFTLVEKFVILVSKPGTSCVLWVEKYEASSTLVYTASETDPKRKEKTL